MSVERVHVKIGELGVMTQEGVLFSIGLGSCVAVALYDMAERIVGLAHVMLPDSGKGPLGRYAPTAVASLLEMMTEAGARPRGITARLAGGAAMFKDVLPAEGLMLGDRNVAAVKAALAAAAVPVIAEDVGGTSGRSVYLDASDGSFVIRRVGKADVSL